VTKLSEVVAYFKISAVSASLCREQKKAQLRARGLKFIDRYLMISSRVVETLNDGLRRGFCYITYYLKRARPVVSFTMVIGLPVGVSYDVLMGRKA